MTSGSANQPDPQTLRPPPTWQTARLRLRPPVESDAAAIFRTYAQDTEVTHYLPWRPHRSLADSETFVARCISVWAEGTAFPWVIADRQTGELLGMVELRIRGAAADLGYLLARPHWGRGIMGEALQPLVDWALAQPGLYRVWAVCDVDNARSARVLERAGFTLEGTLRRWIFHPNAGQEPRDALCYARVK